MKQLIIIIIIGVVVYFGYNYIKDASMPDRVPSLQQTEVVTFAECDQYIRENITTLSPVEEVLGGTWYVTEVEPSGGNYIVSYEDGHIAHYIEVFCSKNNDKVKVELVKDIGDIL